MKIRTLLIVCMLASVITGNTYTQDLFNPRDDNSIHYDFDPGHQNSTEFKRRVYELEHYNITTPNPEFNRAESDSLLKQLSVKLGVSDETEILSLEQLKDMEKDLLLEEEKQDEIIKEAEKRVTGNSDSFMEIKKEMAELQTQIKNSAIDPYTKSYPVSPSEQKQIRALSIKPAQGLTVGISFSRWKPSRPSKPSSNKPESKKGPTRQERKERNDRISILGYQARKSRKKRKGMLKKLSSKKMKGNNIKESLKELKDIIDKRRFGRAKSAKGTRRSKEESKRRGRRTEPEPRLSDRERRKLERRKRKSKEDKKKDRQAKKKAREAKREEKKKNLKAGKGFYTNDQITAINANDGDIFKGLFQSETGIDMTGWGEVAESPWGDLRSLDVHYKSIKGDEPVKRIHNRNTLEAKFVISSIDLQRNPNWEQLPDGRFKLKNHDYTLTPDDWKGKKRNNKKKESEKKENPLIPQIQDDLTTENTSQDPEKNTGSENKLAQIETEKKDQQKEVDKNRTKTNNEDQKAEKSEKFNMFKASRSFFKGLKEGTGDNLKGTWEMIRHPVKFAKTLKDMVVNYEETAEAIKEFGEDKYNQFLEGDYQERAQMIGYATGTVATSVVLAKGLGTVKNLKAFQRMGKFVKTGKTVTKFQVKQTARKIFKETAKKTGKGVKNNRKWSLAALFKKKKIEGPGKFKKVNEHMSKAAKAYQRFITGTDEVYVLKGVKFDGYKNGVLLEAKYSHAGFVNKNTGRFHRWFTGKGPLIKQANRQLGAAGGIKVQWYCSDQATFNAMNLLFEEKQIKGIEVILKKM